MIAVIADDLSGATELASTAIGHGLSAEIQLQCDPGSNADVLALTTESRLPRNPRKGQIEHLARQIFNAKPAWIYKKTDSILRGHVASEIREILRVTHRENALLIPANPKKERLIRDGTYWIGESPLHLTEFAQDPEFPRDSCDVIELARGADEDFQSQTQVFWIGDAQIPAAPGIFVPEMTDTEPMQNRAAQIQHQLEKTLPAGGVEFFEALLRQLGHSPRELTPKPAETSASTLFLCGSSAAWQLGRRDTFQSAGIPVLPMPGSLFQDPENADQVATWAENAGSTLENSARLMLAIGDLEKTDNPPLLTTPLARAAKILIENQGIGRLFVEGGATAIALIRELGWTRLIARTPLAPGLAELEPAEAPEVRICIKPGSYPWPEEFLAP